jgi:hypothetical protein
VIWLQTDNPLSAVSLLYIKDSMHQLSSAPKPVKALQSPNATMSSTQTVRLHSPRQTLSSSTLAVPLPRNSSSEAAAITDDRESD